MKQEARLLITCLIWRDGNSCRPPSTRLRGADPAGGGRGGGLMVLVGGRTLGEGVGGRGGLPVTRLSVPESTTIGSICVFEVADEEE